jgi:shikimate dehydrogenase
LNKVYGLIGKKLSHSFSRSYFEKKFCDLGITDAVYLNFEIPAITEFPKVLSNYPDLLGLNVTNPYKEEIIPFLDELSEEAREIGAVNCIKIMAGKTKGYNTDVYGFSQSIKPFLDTSHERALVLGSGGAAKAVAYALRKIGVEVFFVSSSGKKGTNSFSYSDLNEIIFRSFRLIVNATPLGMFPDVNACPPIPYQFIEAEHLCYDLVYNPAETLFLKKCREQGARTMNGYSMLQLQAEKSWEIWSYGKN